MGRKFRDITTVNQVKVKQKNGDAYVYEREYRYDPVTKRNVRLSNKLIGKIRAGTTEIVPTRPKRQNGISAAQSGSASPVSASRQSDILAGILDWAALESGLEMDLLGSMSEGDALKTASLARFWTVTRNGTIPEVETWQLTHPIPYQEGLSADVCYKLFTDLGLDESARQSLFQKRAERLGDHPMIAYDSTTVSTWSELLEEARYGFNKDKDGRKTVKYLMLYAVDTMQPVAFAKQSGNLPDVTSIGRAIAQLAVLGVSKPQLVTDCGYYSESSLAELCWAGMDFITLAKPCRWLSQIIEEVRDSIQEPQNADPDSEVFVKTVRISRDLVRTRQRGSRKKQLKAGDQESFRRTLYVHVCFNPITKAAEDRALLNRIREVKTLLEAGFPLDELTKSAQRDAETYLQFHQTKAGKIRSIEWNRAAYETACRPHGFFVLVANKEKKGVETLHRYRRREKVEEFFAREKEDVDGNTTRVWSSTALMGRMIVQFAALCLSDFLRWRVQQVKSFLRRFLADPASQCTAKERKRDTKLLRWLEGISFHNLLAWFGVYQNTCVSKPIRRRRWNAETTEQDRRFLQLLKSSVFS